MFKRSILLTGVLIISLAPTGVAQRRGGRASGGEPGRFDYYLLSMSWAPDFCAREDAQRNARECGTGNKVGFIVHGMWPQNSDGTYPQSCGSAQPVAGATVDRMLPMMMDAGLIQHEWRNHGTCSGLTADQYFGAIAKAFQAVKTPDEYRNLSKEIQVSPSTIVAKFQAANPSFHKDAFRVSCFNNELQDVRVCFSKDLKAQACSAAERQCKASSILVRPLR